MFIETQNYTTVLEKCSIRNPVPYISHFFSKALPSAKQGLLSMDFLNGEGIDRELAKCQVIRDQKTITLSNDVYYSAAVQRQNKV